MLLKSTTADKLRTVRLRPSYKFINLMILAVDHRLHEIMILSTTDFVKLSWRLTSYLNYILTTPSSCSRTWATVEVDTYICRYIQGDFEADLLVNCNRHFSNSFFFNQYENLHTLNIVAYEIICDWFWNTLAIGKKLIHHYIQGYFLNIFSGYLLQVNLLEL